MSLRTPRIERLQTNELPTGRMDDIVVGDVLDILLY